VEFVEALRVRARLLTTMPHPSITHDGALMFHDRRAGANLP
jgi:hypothetical protein